jgi:hypothetical protein
MTKRANILLFLFNIAVTVLSFAVYRAILRRFMRSFDMNRHFDTAFKFKTKKPSPREKVSPLAGNELPT